MASSSSTPVHPCRWDYCASIFSSSTALRDHLRDHWQTEEPQRLRVKRQKVGPGQWEAFPEEPKLAATFPLRHPGDTTTTTEGTTLSYPYPPSFPSQPPSLPLFLPIDDDDDLHDARTQSQAHGRRSQEAREKDQNSPRSRTSRTRAPHAQPGPSTQANVARSPQAVCASASSLTIFEPRPPQSSQRSAHRPDTQATDYEKIPGIFDTSFDSSLSSQPSAKGPKPTPSTKQHDREQSEWDCFIENSPDHHKHLPSSSPFVAPTQPIPAQVQHRVPSDHPTSQQSNNHDDSRMDIDHNDPKLETVQSPPQQRSSSSRTKGKPFVAPRSTRPTSPTKLQPSPQKPKYPALGFGVLPNSQSQAPSTDSSTSHGTGSTPSWLTDSSTTSPQPKPSTGVGQGRPSDQEEPSQTRSSSSGSSHKKSDSYSQSKTQFGMALSQGSDKSTQAEVRRISPAGSQGVAFAWGQSR